MKATILCLLALVACSPSSPNLAVSVVTSAAPTVGCTGLYTDVGPVHLHSAMCQAPNSRPVYCTITIDKEPSCRDLFPPPPSNAASASSPPPTTGPTSK